MMARTELQWRGSALGLVASRANFELKRMFGAAREAGIEVGEDSFVGECWQAGISAYQNAMQSWLNDDDDGAVRAIVYAAACIGLMARNNATLTREVQKELANTRWQRLEPVKEWAIEQRRRQLQDDPNAKRAVLVRRIAEDVKERARAADVPLTGGGTAIERTITSWMKNAGM